VEIEISDEMHVVRRDICIAYKLSVEAKSAPERKLSSSRQWLELVKRVTAAKAEQLKKKSPKVVEVILVDMREGKTKKKDVKGTKGRGTRAIGGGKRKQSGDDDSDDSDRGTRKKNKNKGSSDDEDESQEDWVRKLQEKHHCDIHKEACLIGVAGRAHFRLTLPILSGWALYIVSAHQIDVYMGLTKVIGSKTRSERHGATPKGAWSIANPICCTRCWAQGECRTHPSSSPLSSLSSLSIPRILSNVPTPTSPNTF